MKKTIPVISLITAVLILSSCTRIENNADSISADNDISTTTVTIQTESPVIQTVETTTETTVMPTETSLVTTEQTTTESTQVTTTKASEVTTTVATTAKPIETTVATTTTAVTTTPAPVINTNKYNTLNYGEQKGMWISYLEYISMLKGKSKSQFTESVRTMYNNCVNMGINTVYVHARSHSDSYYISDYYPWSKYCTGTVGVDPGFDPFQILVDEAHSRGLSIHAWINPLRGMSDSDIKKVSNNYLMKQWYNDSSKNGTYIVNVKGVWYLNPSYQEPRNLIINGVKEIISKYNVDGIHIDDYFYPTTDNYFDQAAFNSSGYSDLSQYRLDTVSNMVKELYSAIKATNPSVVFGVSPQGNIGNNYAFQYADVRKWTSQNGYLDYIVPQIYYGFNNKSQPYATNLQTWCDMVTNTNVKLVAGLAAYKVGTSESTGEWANDSRILARQTETFKMSNKYGGVAFFRYESLFSPASGVASKVNAEVNELSQLLK